MNKLTQCIQLLLDAEKAGNLQNIEIEELQKFLGLKQKPRTFKILIDYSLTLEAVIGLGKYDWKNDHINSNKFLIKGEGKIELNTKLIHFNKYISSEDILKELDKKGLRPANIEEILAFGAQHPEEQRKFSIVGLGSSCKILGRRCAPSLDSDGSNRYLRLIYWDGDWDADSRFLAVAKQLSDS